MRITQTARAVASDEGVLAVRVCELQELDLGLAGVASLVHTTTVAGVASSCAVSRVGACVASTDARSDPFRADGLDVTRVRLDDGVSDEFLACAPARDAGAAVR